MRCPCGGKMEKCRECCAWFCEECGDGCFCEEDDDPALVGIYEREMDELLGPAIGEDKSEI